METIISASIFFMVVAAICTFICGRIWESSHSQYGWAHESSSRAFFLTVIAALLYYIGTSLLWVKLGEMKVETREVPVVERKIMHKECIGVIESDTLYVFKFE